MSIFKTSGWDLFQPITEQKEPPERTLWAFMVKYQEEHQMPPTLDEMTEVLSSEHRSSAKHFVEKLIAAGWVVEVAEEGKSRRYRATNAPTGGIGDPTQEMYTRLIPKVNF